MSNVQKALKSSIETLERLDGWLKTLRVTGNIGLGYPELETLEKCKAALVEIEKCEPVAQAIRERDRLGFAVVKVMTKLDEIIENTQEAEIDDFLHIAIPIDMWNELQAALEDMPKRADFYTSPQPRECEPVYLILSGADEIVVTKEKYDSWTSAKRISYTSPHPRDWVGLSEAKIESLAIQNKFWYGDNKFDWFAYSSDLILELKQLNTKG